MSSTDPKSVVLRYYEEVGFQRKFEVADEIFAPEFKMFPNSEPPFGPEGVKQFLQGFVVETFPDLTVTVDDVVAEGDTVAVAVTLKATHNNTAFTWVPGMPAEPTGKSFGLREFVFWKVKDGKIVERKLVVDWLEALQQLRE
jgi:predicted ester cyclase